LVAILDVVTEVNSAANKIKTIGEYERLICFEGRSEKR